MSDPTPSRAVDLAISGEVEDHTGRHPVSFHLGLSARQAWAVIVAAFALGVLTTSYVRDLARSMAAVPGKLDAIAAKLDAAVRAEHASAAPEVIHDDIQTAVRFPSPRIERHRRPAEAAPVVEPASP